MGKLLYAIYAVIVVMAATPTQCAEVVLLLASLTLPLAHAGDVRPYMHPDDSDLAILAATASEPPSR